MIAVSPGPRGIVSDTTAKASVIAPASANQRFRPSRPIHPHSMDETSDFQVALGLRQITMVIPPRHSSKVKTAFSFPPEPLSAATPEFIAPAKISWEVEWLASQKSLVSYGLPRYPSSSSPP